MHRGTRRSAVVTTIRLRDAFDDVLAGARAGARALARDQDFGDEQDAMEADEEQPGWRMTTLNEAAAAPSSGVPLARPPRFSSSRLLPLTAMSPEACHLNGRMCMQMRNF
jgi:hypothetical protein